MENQEEMLKRFDEKFPELWSSNDGREGYDAEVSNSVKSFIQSEINLALANRNKEIAEELHNWTNENYRTSSNPVYAWVDARSLANKINLITKDNE